MSRIAPASEASAAWCRSARRVAARLETRLAILSAELHPHSPQYPARLERAADELSAALRDALLDVAALRSRIPPV